MNLDNLYGHYHPMRQMAPVGLIPPLEPERPAAS
jgi:hypothetical protein